MTEEEREYHRNWRESKKSDLEWKSQKAAYQREYRKSNKQTMRVSEKKTYQKNADARCEHQRDYRKSNLPTVMVSTTRKKSSCLGLPFDLTVNYIKSIWPKDDCCPILKTPFEIAAKGSNRNTSASIDRVIPNKGYTQGNVVIISMLANRIKNNATPEQVQAVGNYYADLSLRA